MGSCFSSCDCSSTDSENEAAGGRVLRRGPPTCLIFTVAELAAATNNFNVNCLLGEGGYGPIYRGKLGIREGGFGPVYSEKLERAGYNVAIRRLHPIAPRRVLDFVDEMTILSELDNPNIVSFIGFCNDDGQRFLVYEYMANGSLESHLFRRNSNMEPLDWRTRIEIALSVANGLEYLHVERKPPILHRNLKCSNILLGEDYQAKLSDFGLTDKKHGFCVRELPEMGKMNKESDIYAFGVLLLEIITGRKVLDRSSSAEAINLVARAQEFPSMEGKDLFNEMADKSLKYITEVGFNKAAILASECLQEDPSRRPPIVAITDKLAYIRARN